MGQKGKLGNRCSLETTLLLQELCLQNRLISVGQTRLYLILNSGLRKEQESCGHFALCPCLSPELPEAEETA